MQFSSLRMWVRRREKWQTSGEQGVFKKRVRWKEDSEEIKAGRGEEDFKWLVPCSLLCPNVWVCAHLLVKSQSCSLSSIWFEARCSLPKPFHIFVYFTTHKCEGKAAHECISTHTVMRVCLSPGQEDTGISRDELLIDEAVIEVCK